MLAALLEGESDPQVLASLAQDRLQAKRAELERALQGRVRDRYRFLLTEYLSHLDYLDEAIERFGLEMAQRLSPFEEGLMPLDSIPGVNQRVGEIVLAEVEADLSRFPSAEHLAEWTYAQRQSLAAAGAD
jgi:transposase